MKLTEESLVFGVSLLAAAVLSTPVAEAQETSGAASAAAAPVAPTAPAPAPAAPAPPVAAPPEVAPAGTASPAAPAPDATSPDAAAASATAPVAATASPAPIPPPAPEPQPVAATSNSNATEKQKQAEAKAETEPPEPPGLGTYQRHVEVGVGLRNNWFADEGYSQFDEDSYMPQLSLTAGYAFWNADSWSLAGHGTWDYGSSSSDLRGLTSDLSLHRMTLGLSLRYHFARRLFAFARVAPGARFTSTSLKDSTATFSDTQWAFVTDLTAGAQVQLLKETRNDSHAVRWWVGVEGGYAFGSKTDTVLNASDGTPARTEPVVLDPLELGGGVLRLNTSLTF